MKVIGWIIGIVALLLVAVGVYVVLNSGALLERAMESYGSRYLGAPVAVDEVTVSLAEGTSTINGLEVGNPSGFSGPPAFQLGSVSVTLDPQQTSSELIVLKSVTIDGAQVAALAKGSETNLKRLMDHLNAEIGASERAEETGVQSEVKLIIDRFAFTNAHASVASDLLGEAAIDLPDVYLNDIGRQSGGATVGEVLKQVLQPIYQAVTREMVRRGVDLEGTRERLEEDLRERAGKKLGDTLDSLTNKLRRDDEQ